MTWDTATEVLNTDQPSFNQVQALDKFVESHSKDLTKFYHPENTSNRGSISKFIARLFTLLEQPSTSGQTDFYAVLEKTAKLIANKQFFTDVFTYAIRDLDQSLLELVYSSLFTEIVFTSELTIQWFKELNSNLSNLRAKPTSELSLVLLISAQMLDMNQDWKLVKPDAEFLENLHSIIDQMDWRLLKLLWWLTLFSMADQHYTTEEEDDVEIEPLMHKLQVKNGLHWSEVLKNEVSLNLNAVTDLVKSLETVKTMQFKIIAAEGLAQTVADVLKYVLMVSKPTVFLTSSLAMCVKMYPFLQNEQWLSTEYIALAKTKCPLDLGGVISVAECLNLESRVEYLHHMHTYTCVLPTDSLDFQGKPPQNCINTVLQIKKTELILPHRAASKNSGLVAEAGTTSGTLLAVDEDKCLMMLRFKYSAWMLIGRILENRNLEEQNLWSPLTVEILTLITMTMDRKVLTELSSVLATGDIVDLVSSRLQNWIHEGYSDYAFIGFEFLTSFALISPSRVWVILSQMVWSKTDHKILNGLKLLLEQLWPTFDEQNELHSSVVSVMVRLFAWHCLSIDGFDMCFLPVFKMFLPVSLPLQTELLSTSRIRDISLSPIMENLDKREVVEFCTFCIKFVSKGTLMQTRETTCLEGNLFWKTRNLAYLFLEDTELRPFILELWSVLSLNTESPPLLAFIDEQVSSKLKQALFDIIVDGMVSAKTIELIAQFVFSARRQEGLLDLLRGGILDKLEEQVLIMTEPSCVNAILNSLRLLKRPLKKQTVEFLVKEITSNKSIEPVQLEIKCTAIYLLTSQLHSNAEIVETSIPSITKLTVKLATMHEVKPVLKTQLRLEPSVDAADIERSFVVENPVWLSKNTSPSFIENLMAKIDANAQTDVIVGWCNFLKLASTILKSATPEAKNEWAAELLRANNNVLPTPSQLAEINRTETAWFILQQNIKHPSLDVLTITMQQLIDITVRPSFSLVNSNKWLIALLKALVTQLSSFEKGQVNQDVLLSILKIVVIKQLAQIGASETLLVLHLSILKDCLRLLNNENQLSSLVQMMTETGCDAYLLKIYSTAQLESPRIGALAMKHVLEWLKLPGGIMTDNFVGNGLLNVLIEAPISRFIQQPDSNIHEHPRILDLWCNEILQIVLRLLVQLNVRFSMEGWLFVSTYKNQILTCWDQWKTGRISILLINETLMIYALLNTLKGLGSGATSSSTARDMVEVRFDKEELQKHIDMLLSHQKYLNSRISESEDKGKVSHALSELNKIILN